MFSVNSPARHCSSHVQYRERASTLSRLTELRDRPLRNADVSILCHSSVRCSLSLAPIYLIFFTGSIGEIAFTLNLPNRCRLPSQQSTPTDDSFDEGSLCSGGPGKVLISSFSQLSDVLQLHTFSSMFLLHLDLHQMDT